MEYLKRLMNAEGSNTKYKDYISKKSRFIKLYNKSNNWNDKNNNEFNKILNIP